MNAVSGETAGWSQTGYVFGPWQAYEISGWRKSDQQVAAFEFTAAPDSYAARTGLPQNGIYDLMTQAGVPLALQRICQPYGDDQRRGLWLFHLLEPETWGRIVARVNGSNHGSLYARERGNVLGNGGIDKPRGHTWESYAKLLLASMPPRTRMHFENKIAVFLKWWMDRGYASGIPDEMPRQDETARDAPSWRRVCRALLRNDYWCKSLSFSQHRSQRYEQYLAVMKARRAKWKII